MRDRLLTQTLALSNQAASGIEEVSAKLEGIEDYDSVLFA